MVEPVAVVVQACLDVEVLGREPIGEPAGRRAGLGDRVAEGVELAARSDVALRVNIRGNVTVRVVERVMDAAVATRDREQPADPARALLGAAEVSAPGVVVGRYRLRTATADCHCLPDHVPAVVEEGVGAGNLKLETGGLADADLLADAARLVVVGVRDEKHAVGAGAGHAIFRVPRVGPRAVGEHAAVGVVGGGNHKGLPVQDIGVLVQRVGEIGGLVGRPAADCHCRLHPVTVAAASRDTAPRSVHPHGLKIAVARRLCLGLGALLIADRVVCVSVCVSSHERVRDL